MTSGDNSSGPDREAVPFGALEPPAATKPTRRRSKKPAGAERAAADRKPAASADDRPAEEGGASSERGASGPHTRDGPNPRTRRGPGRRGRRRRRGKDSAEGDGQSAETAGQAVEGGGVSAQADRPRGAEDRAGEGGAGEGDERSGRRRRGRRNRRRGRSGDGEGPEGGQGSEAQGGKPGGAPKGGKGQGGKAQGGGKPKPGQVIGECEGLLIVDKGGHGKLRQAQNHWLADNKNDVHVGPKQIQKYALREGALVKGRYGLGFGKHKFDLYEVTQVDGRDPKEARSLGVFKNLTSIDPDFQYEVGDFSGDTSMRVIDMICPVGRGQRGLIVAPPRTGKTTLLRKFAQAIEEHYPDVHLMVLLVDERPEEATEWKRSVKGEVFVSTNDEMPKRHVDLCEVVWARCRRLVELGEDVILLLDSITRMARAYNNVKGNSGKTMSGGLDSRAMERPKQFFGSARNTETAGSLTILGTTLIETGSQMDKVIFEEFKGTGNMELVLSRKLADRRIFPAIDLERSGTRKEEKLFSSTRLRRVSTLRRVLARMNFIEGMELLITKLDDVERNDDFLKRFDVDPEA